MCCWQLAVTGSYGLAVVCFEVLHLLESPLLPTVPSFTQQELSSTSSKASIAGFLGSRIARKAEGLEQQVGQRGWWDLFRAAQQRPLHPSLSLSLLVSECKSTSDSGYCYAHAQEYSEYLCFFVS